MPEKNMFLIQMFVYGEWKTIDRQEGKQDNIGDCLSLASAYVNGFGDGNMEDLFRLCEVTCKNGQKNFKVIV